MSSLLLFVSAGNPKSFCFLIVSDGCMVLFSIIEYSIVPTLFLLIVIIYVCICQDDILITTYHTTALRYLGHVVRCPGHFYM